jgi:Golgi phosphoprotein 3 (GPP34)
VNQAQIVPAALRGEETSAVYPLADEFFRLAHNDVTGKPRLHPRATELGLAAALLGELLFGNRITLHRGVLEVVDDTPPRDAVAHDALDQIVTQPQHTAVRVWLEFLSHGAYQGVAQRLWRAGHLRPETSRRLLRQVVTWRPTDVNTAAWPSARLSHSLSREEPLDQADTFLAGLATATGLDEDLIERGNPGAHHYLRRLVATAPQQVRELLAHTHAAVGDAVLSYRA